MKDSKNEKAVGQNSSSAEFSMKMGAVRVIFLTTLFYKMLRGNRIADQWGESVLMSLCKGKVLEVYMIDAEDVREVGSLPV